MRRSVSRLRRRRAGAHAHKLTDGFLELKSHDFFDHHFRRVARGNEGADYKTCLLRLSERELLDREQRAAQRRLKTANFSVIKTLDTFDFSAQPSINKALIHELLNGDYIA